MISKRLKDMFDRQAESLQQGVQDAFCSAAGGVKKSFDEDSKVVDRSSCLIVELCRHDESAKPASLLAHSASGKPPMSWTRAACNGGDAPISGILWSSAPAFPDATDPRNYPGQYKLTAFRYQRN